MSPKKAQISKDEVEALSRGEATRSRSGSRTIGHRLTQKERILFERAKKTGELNVPVVGVRKNLTNIYLKWCEATNTPPKIVSK